MSVKVKICGISDEVSLHTALDAGADYIGLVFFEKSPRNISAKLAKNFKTIIGKKSKSVGLFVNSSVHGISKILDDVDLDILQLHGSESPKQISEIASAFPQTEIIKAIAISSAEDLAHCTNYDGLVDYLLLDAKAPKDSAIPGGNGLSFPWEILADRAPNTPWMLAGGLTPYNVANAVAVTNAQIVDVSSGVEESRGKKSNDLIKKFIDAAKNSGR